ncbi:MULTISPECIES: host-nuclease inhibitor Gam family protein [unclassified Ensifer]|uniref:host-nuclease inhibitor Gam family protein n=1 Tax=unclassified Ensifer TaxID=2633371 RepID=UPI00081306DC|nr:MULTISPECIES: host-nuclease inhibitor Gam family protein [unclassified Ensifer]OCP17393.1 nuclease inhibitor protein [Ensifer sp. LC54]OCP28701.1 nuclease inhibitor protein [Ensifer sp. LC384]
MKAALKNKSKALSRVPQSREDAVWAIGRIGTLRRLIAQRKSEADEVIRKAGEELETNTADLVAELGEHEKGVQTWCEANRLSLTSDGKVKFHEFGTGRINWRQRPPKVAIRGVETVIEACKKLGLKRFLRVKEELNKDAMLADPDKARQIAGVSISSEGEDFVIEPAEIETSQTAA